MLDKKKITKNGLIIIALGFIGLQFVRPTKNNAGLESTQDISKVVEIPSNIHLMLKSACYDCHSNQTTYPWYSEIMPFGWWINHHVEEGKAELNFSEFGAYSTKRKDHKLEEIGEEIVEGEMPLGSYKLAHKEAELTTSQVEELQKWVLDARRKLVSTEAIK